MRARLLLVVGLWGCGGGEVDAPPGSPPAGPLSAGDLRVEVSADRGSFDVLRRGEPVVVGASADALVTLGPDERLVSLDGGCAGRAFDGHALSCAEAGVRLSLSFELLEGGQALVLELRLRNETDAPLVVRRLSPLVAQAERGGALRLGARPPRHRILENGRYGVFDQTAQIEQGDARPYVGGVGLGLPFRGSSVSNWSHAVVDLDDPTRSLVAGYLTFERTVPTLGLTYDVDVTTPGPDGRIPFQLYAADNVLFFSGRRLAPGDELASEALYLDPLPADPLAALERYADEVARRNSITPWTRRGPGHEVPNGWNSWSGGSSTGGYGQSIDQNLIAANMAVLQAQLLPFGDTYFQIDDGWQQAHGDWFFRPDTFPAGGAAQAQAIAQAGLRSGLWLAPFWVEPGSKLAAAHPDWLQPSEDNPASTAGKDRQTLDLTNPAALDHVRSTHQRLRDEGWRWIKTDFTYLDPLGKPQFDPGQTNIEALRAGYRAVREGLGPDVFVLGIGLIGANIGYADGMRLTLDNGPRWDEPSAGPTLESPRAMKGTVRTGSRRWFYQNRVWINHDDLIFFRSWPDDGAPPLSLDEARAFATWIGIMGGSVELGDKLPDLTPPQIDVVRRLLPAYAPGARPLDVMLRDYPERFLQEVDAPAGRWQNLALCNWGKNRDLSTEPPTPLPEATRSYTVDPGPDGALVHEFWSGSFLGLQRSPFQVEVEPRRCKVLALRPALDQPQLLGTNRHITQGATDLEALTWDASTRTLRGRLLGAAGTELAPFAYELALHAPAGFSASSARVDGVDTPQLVQQDEVVRLGFSLAPAQSGQAVAFEVTF